jgi:hypothetical protein
MRDKIPKYLRMIVACGIAFGISYLISARQYTTPTQFDLVRLSTDTKALVASIPSVQLPSFNLATFSTQIVPPTPTPEPTVLPQNDTAQGGTDTAPIDGVPTSTPYIQPSDDGSPTSTLPQPKKTPLTTTPTRPKPTAAPPTAIPPTNTPKPTKPPAGFPIDPSLKRPGTTTADVFSIASQKTCVPAPVLRAIGSIESGGFFDQVDPKYFQLYNSYEWWKSSYLTDVKRACGGYDYDGNTGIIPDDSNFAGQTCPGAMGGDLVVRGPMSVSDYWEGKYKPKAAKLLGVSAVDQRVILDAIVIVGLSVNDNVKPSSCQSWSAHDVAKAACVYYGSCKDGYCSTFCKNITKFGGQNCSGAVSQFANGCYN